MGEVVSKIPRVLVVAVLLTEFASGLAAQGQGSDAERAARRQAFQEQLRARDALLKEWEGVVEQEAAREQGGDCREAQTTRDDELCLGHEVEVTTANYQHLADFIRSFLKLSHGGPDTVSTGATGTSHTGDEMVKAFDDVEKAWTTYHTALCSTASAQYQSGTIAPSVGLRCDLRAFRSHMQELDGTFQPISR
jgi:uncharacterized protein YecT (DUF1311 family)